MAGCGSVGSVNMPSPRLGVRITNGVGGSLRV
jgi:hypothetical protein